MPVVPCPTIRSMRRTSTSQETVYETGETLPKLLLGVIRWLGALGCAVGGILWALTPLGIHLSELKLKTPNVFWKLFPSAPLLLLVGLVGLYFLCRDRRAGRWMKAGLLVTLLGALLTVVGDVGQFWLKVDNAYIMAAPAYRTFRVGLFVLGVGSVLFGLFAARAKMLPLWSILPFVIASWAGLISFSRNLESLGAGLWIVFGIGWAWLGIAFLVELAVAFRRIGQDSGIQHDARQGGSG